MIIATPVMLPCPISATGIAMSTVPSGEIDTQAPIGLISVPAALAIFDPPSSPAGIVMAKVSPAELRTKARRDSPLMPSLRRRRPARSP